MPLDIGRVTHLTDQMHRSEDDAGDPIDSGFLLAADGARGHVWTDPSTLSTTGFLDWTFGTDPAFGGLVGDDSADDSAVLQAGLDATPTGGVYYLPLPAVAYKITVPLNIPDQIRILGAGAYIGQYTKIRQATANTTAFSNTGAFSVAMDGIQVTSTAGSAGNAFYTTGSVHLSRCLFQGFQDGLYLDQTAGGATIFYVNIEHGCFFDSATRDGIHIEGGANNINIRGIRCDSNGRHGIYASGGVYSLRITGNSFDANATTNITIDGTGSSKSTKAVLIEGNYFGLMTGAQTADVSIGPTTRVYGVDIIGNYFEQATAAALYHVRLNFVTGARVAGGFIGQSSEAGVLLCDATNTINVILEYGNWTGTITTPATTNIIDPATFTAPVDVGDANSAGTSKFRAPATHVHKLGGTVGGDLSGTLPNPSVVDDSHNHTSATAPGGSGGHILLADGHATPFSFNDLLQMDDGSDFMWSDP